MPTQNSLEKLFDAYADIFSSSTESDAYLRECGLDPDALVTNGLKQIREFQNLPESEPN